MTNERELNDYPLLNQLCDEFSDKLADFATISIELLEYIKHLDTVTPANIKRCPRYQENLQTLLMFTEASTGQLMTIVSMIHFSPLLATMIKPPHTSGE